MLVSSRNPSPLFIVSMAKLDFICPVFCTRLSAQNTVFSIVFCVVYVISAIYKICPLAMPKLQYSIIRENTVLKKIFKVSFQFTLIEFGSSNFKQENITIEHPKKELALLELRPVKVL